MSGEPESQGTPRATGRGRNGGLKGTKGPLLTSDLSFKQLPGSRRTSPWVLRRLSLPSCTVQTVLLKPRGLACEGRAAPLHMLTTLGSGERALFLLQFPFSCLTLGRARDVFSKRVCSQKEVGEGRDRGCRYRIFVVFGDMAGGRALPRTPPTLGLPPPTPYLHGR